MIPSYPMDFLWWMRMVAFFRDDARENLKELGVDWGVSFALTTCEGFIEADVVKFWGAYGRKSTAYLENEYSKATELYFEFYKKRWDEIKEKQLTI